MEINAIPYYNVFKHGMLSALGFADLEVYKLSLASQPAYLFSDGLIVGGIYASSSNWWLRSAFYNYNPLDFPSDKNQWCDFL